MAISLASDILSETLSYLDSYQDLYSALLVNRYWSKNAVRRLWKDPFPRVTMADDPKQDNRRRKLVATCLSFLPDETRINLGLASNQSMLSKFRRIYHLNLPSSESLELCTQSPSFEYIMYTRRLRLEDVAYAVWVWCNSSYNPNVTKRKVWQTIATFWSFLMQTIYEFEKVSLDITIRLDKKQPFDILRNGFGGEEQFWLRQILLSTSGHQNIISTIFCRYSRHVQLLSQISMQCSTLQHLSIIISKNCLFANELAPFVKSFTNLISFKLSFWKDCTIYDDDLSPLVNVLSTCESLISLDLEGGYIKQKDALLNLVKCPKLKRIKLQNAIGSSEVLRPLVDEKFPKLETFVLRQHDILGEQEYSHVCSDIIRTHGSTLRSIEISLPEACVCDDTMILETIAADCSSLRKLTIEISTIDQIQELISVLTHCPNLHRLKITECFKPYITERLLKSVTAYWPYSSPQPYSDGLVIDRNSAVESTCHYSDDI